MIARKEYVEGIWTPEVMIPARYAFLVRFFDPRTQRFEEAMIDCPSALFARFATGEWVRLRLNTSLWKPLQHWVLDE